MESNAADELEYLEQLAFNKKSSNFASLMGDNLDKNLSEIANIRIRDSVKTSERNMSTKSVDALHTDSSGSEMSDSEVFEKRRAKSQKDKTKLRRTGFIREHVQTTEPIYSHVINIGNCTFKTRLE
jgi:2-phospho-L-lactate transferase/gluconeogenesis factor (CofD/UPF0052 family)